MEADQGIEKDFKNNTKGSKEKNTYKGGLKFEEKSTKKDKARCQGHSTFNSSQSQWPPVAWFWFNKSHESEYYS